MAEIVWLYFGGWGLVLVVAVLLANVAAHVLWFHGYSTCDLIAKVCGFLGLVAIFVISGWKGGVVCILLEFVVSFLTCITMRHLLQRREMEC
jgi:hypothetical protein